ncbi:MAG: PDZ domain-containing protein, partial [Nitrospinales bacterium]
EAFGLVETNGVLVGEVKPGSPADKGGIKQGDVIVRFDTHYIRVLGDLPKAIQITPTGQAVEVQIIRDRKMKTLNVTLTALPAPDREKPLASFDKSLGMEIREITRRQAQQLKLQDVAGVIISEIMPDKPAAEAGLRRGDIIAEVNQKPVANLADYLRITANLDKGVVLFLVKRGENTMFIGVHRG